jgi:hypothetical protein
MCGVEVFSARCTRFTRCALCAKLHSRAERDWNLTATDSTDVILQDDRLNHACTMGLTAILYQIVVSQMLPSLSYLTVMDKFVLTAFLYVALVIIEIGVLCSYNFGEYETFVFGFQVNFSIVIFMCVVAVVRVKLFVLPVERAKLSQHSESLEDTNKRYQLVAEDAMMVSNHFPQKFLMDRWHGKTELYNECIAYFANAHLAGIKDVALTALSGIWYSENLHGSEAMYLMVTVCTHENGKQGDTPFNTC